MAVRHLTVTYRSGRPLAAYLQVARRTEPVVRSERRLNGLVVDFAAADVVVGIEITAPSAVTAEQLDELLAELGLPLLAEGELAPLAA